MKRWTVTEPYLQIKGGLLEGPLYDERRGKVQFIDIEEEFLYEVDPNEGPASVRRIKTEDAVSVIANISGSEQEIIVGAKHGYAILDKSTGKMRDIKKFYEAEGEGKSTRMRCNDGAVDKQGRFWAGTMMDHRFYPGVPEPEGTLFRLDSDLSMHPMLHHVHTPNGIGWNASNDTLYWTDSVPQDIYAFDYDEKTGNISNQRLFYHIDMGPGINPDGLVVDSENCIWTAIWGGFKVLRISPQGQLIGEVMVPTKFVTCPAFVGSQLLITTAKDKDVQTTGIEQGGDVYMLDVGVTGAVKHEFRLQK